MDNQNVRLYIEQKTENYEMGGRNFMFNHLLKKKSIDIETLLQEVKKSEEKGFNAMFEAYFQLGKAYFKQENYEKAMFYLNRADCLSLSIEDLEVSDKEMDECSQMIVMLEDKIFYQKKILDIEEKTENLNYVQMTLWNLFTLCRLNSLFQAFADKPNCEVLQKVPHILQLILKILTEGISQEEYSYGIDFVNELYDFSDSETFYNPHTTADLISSNEKIQMFDFVNGDTMTSLHIFVDHELQNYVNKETSDQFATDFVASALGTMIGFYLRTQDEEIHKIPQIQKELQRIDDDYQMILDEPELQDITERMNDYLQMNIFE